jgi:hypothetical protein
LRGGERRQHSDGGCNRGRQAKTFTVQTNHSLSSMGKARHPSDFTTGLVSIKSGHASTLWCCRQGQVVAGEHVHPAVADARSHSRDASASGSNGKIFASNGREASVHEQKKKGRRSAERRVATATPAGVARPQAGGRSPSGASRRRLSRRSTARNSVQAALHAMKCEGITSARVTALKRSTSRLGHNAERVDARTAREWK